MFRKTTPAIACIVLCLGLALAIVGCSSGNSSKDPVQGTLFGSHRMAGSENGLSLSATPPKIEIDPDNPSTPIEGNRRYGVTKLLAIATDSGGVPQIDVELTFHATAGVFEPASMPIKTDSEGRASVDLKVYEDNPDSIEVSVTDQSRTTTIVVEKIVFQAPDANAGEDQTVECTGNQSAEVTLDGSGSSDPNGDIDTYEWFENSVEIWEGPVAHVVLPLGSHTITLKVTDVTGKTDTDDVTVTVEDTKPPIVHLTMKPSVLWPPNHRLVDVSAEFVVEECGLYTIRLLSVTSNEPDNDLGDGDTANDIQYVEAGTDDTSFKLRAERAGGGNGRIYTVVYSVVDAGGRETIAEAQVKVPHDQRGM